MKPPPLGMRRRRHRWVVLQIPRGVPGQVEWDVYTSRHDAETYARNKAESMASNDGLVVVSEGGTLLVIRDGVTEYELSVWRSARVVTA